MADTGDSCLGKEQDMGGKFGYENRFFSIVNKIADGFLTGLLWILFSLPLFTICTASCALYYTIHKSVRGSRGYIWQSFWGAFKSNFRQTTKIWLVSLAIFAFLFTDYRIMRIAIGQGRPFELLYYIFLILMLYVAVWCVYVYAYAARFDSGMKDTMKNAAFMALIHLPWSLLILAVLAGCVLLIYLIPPVFLFLPSAACCLFEMILEKIFRKYMSSEDLEREKELDSTDWG